MTGADGIIPIRVKVPVYAMGPLRARAAAAGFTSATEYVESVALDLALGSEKAERVFQMHAGGATNRQIAEATGLTVGSIQTRLSKAGLRSNREKK